MQLEEEGYIFMGDAHWLFCGWIVGVRRWRRSVLTILRRRFPRQHVRFCRCFGPGQG